MPLSNSTFLSSPDWDGSCYWCSFDAKSFARGERLKAYVGVMNGRGPRTGERSVVKVFLGDIDTQTACDVEIRKSKKAREISRAFNQHFAGDVKKRVTFARVLKASMDEVSFVATLSGHASRGRHKPRKDQWVVIEERLGKRVTAFIGRDGRSDTSARCRLLEALVHFSYHESGGQLVLCNLEGCLKEGDTLCCKTPTLHSRGAHFGREDRGPTGLHDVLRHHVCNDLCRGLLALPSDLQDWPQPPQEDPARFLCPLPVPLEPSAPYDPEQLQFLLRVDSADMPPSPPPYSIDPVPLVYYYACRKGAEHAQRECLRFPLF